MTRAVLIEAAQRLIAEGRQNVAVLEITQLADVGLGSFYNHFDSKEQLYQAALDDVLDKLGVVLDALTGDVADPAEAFTQSFRLQDLLRAFGVPADEAAALCRLPLPGLPALPPDPAGGLAGWLPG